ncbi:MAG: aromatic ring-hydroxylating dioxygenase subunit alpha [Novosphingobium sp.]|nr:aromatic ring-hydroxylating dioxygenase subunit alpha [Novosphingobium sp.]
MSASSIPGGRTKADDSVSLEIEDAPHPLQALRRRLAGPLVRNVASGQTALSPEVLHETVAFYRDPSRFAGEQRRFFRETPVVACLSAELPEPGSFRTFDEAGIPIVLTRGKDGIVRAFLNVCPHRASRIVRETQGKASRFTCRFHGWTFDCTGKALGIPGADRFGAPEDIDPYRNLIACPAEERHGLVFVLPDPEGVMDLNTHLAGIESDLAAIGLGDADVVHEDVLSVDANWKYGLDTFFETYHLNALHFETFRGLFSPICVFDTFGPHHRYTFAPLGIEGWTDMAETDWPVDAMPLQYFLFPNTIISVGSTSPKGLTVNVHRIFPSSADHFTSSLSYCAIGGIVSAEHREEVERAYLVARAALVDEDYSVAAEAHSGLAALPAKTNLPVGRQEIGVWNFHRNVDRLLGSTDLSQA